MSTISLVAQNPDAVRAAIEMGEIVHLDTASEEITDEFLLFAIKSGLLTTWAEGFPDPRVAPEIGIHVLLAAMIAARFAGLYSMRKTGYVLRSARVLGALGFSPVVLEAGEGISLKGTGDDAPLSGDVVRKLLVKMESEVEMTEATRAQFDVTEPSEVVKTRARPSRRSVKKAVDEVEAERRGWAVCQALTAWYTTCVGMSLLAYARLGAGRRIHILDATKIEVALETATYEGSGVVRDDEGKLSRGYKIGTLRTLLDTAGIITGVAFGPIQRHDVVLCRELIRTSPVLRAGDLLVEDRGFLDGQDVTDLKARRRLDLIVPLKSNMLSYAEAVGMAKRAATWEPHPSRPGQFIAFVEGVSHVWDACSVPLNACVIRFFNKKKKALDFIVLVTTDLSLNANWIVRHYQERPEIEQDYQQMKSGGWLLKKLSSQRLSQIVLYVLSIILAYSLYHLFSNTQAGARFADKTREAIKIEQLKTRRTHIIVYAGGYFDIYETLHFLHLVLHLPLQVQQRVRSWLDQHLDPAQEFI